MKACVGALHSSSLQGLLLALANVLWLKNRAQPEQGISQDLESLHSFEAILQEFQAKGENLIMKRRRDYNSGLPINRLPTESLIEIFLSTLRGARKMDNFSGLPNIKNHYQQLRIITEVSFGWAALVYGTPSLWHVVHSENPASLQVKALSRSKWALPDIFYRGSGVADEPSLQRFIEHVDRWRSLDYRSGGGGTGLGLLTGICAPRLESLSLHHMAPSVMEAGLLVEKMDRLRHLSLSGCSISWNSGLLSGLNTLALSHLGAAAPSLDRLLGMLQSSPALIRLQLSSLTPEARIRSSTTLNAGAAE